MTYSAQQAQLDAIAATRAVLANDAEGAAALFRLSEDPREMAHAACGFAAALLAMMPEDRSRLILDGLTAAALAEG